MRAGIESVTALRGCHELTHEAAVEETENYPSAKGKVSFLLESNAGEPSLDAVEQDSIDSNESVDGEESDIDDEAFVLSDETDEAAVKAHKVDLLTLFQGSRYRVISLLFGPMLCFFFIA